MATFKDKPPRSLALERFVRLASAAGNTDTLIKIVASHRKQIDLCRKLVRKLSENPTGDQDIRSACRRSGTTPRHLLDRLKPVVQALPTKPPRNHYERLCIPRDATTAEIRRAYRRQARTLHPDHNPDGGDGSLAFINLTAAYQTLSHPQQRADYDRMLAAPQKVVRGPTEPAMPEPPPPKGYRFPVGLVVLLPLLVIVAFVLDFVHRHGGFAPPPIPPRASSPPEHILKSAVTAPEPLTTEQSPQPLTADHSAPATKRSNSVLTAEPGGPMSNQMPQGHRSLSDQHKVAATDAPRPEFKAAAASNPLPVKASPMLVDDPRSRLVDFLNLYCRAYESRDLRRLAILFHAEAKENGRPFGEILPLYRSNFKRIDTLAYRIELDHYKRQQRAPESFTVKGRFFARAHVVKQGVRESHGTIDMTLVADGGSFLVKRLDYALTH